MRGAPKGITPGLAGPNLAAGIIDFGAPLFRVERSGAEFLQFPGYEIEHHVRRAPARTTAGQPRPESTTANSANVTNTAGRKGARGPRGSIADPAPACATLRNVGLQ